MFLWQKYKYNLSLVNDDAGFDNLERMYNLMKPEIVAWDTETTGLHIIRDKPFLVGLGFYDRLFIFPPKPEYLKRVYSMVSKHTKYFVAHNAKFDYHMVRNIGAPIPESVPVACSLALARLTDYVDTLTSHSLESLGKVHVDESSKFASDVIKEHLRQINTERRKIIKEYVKDNLDISYTKFMEIYSKKVQFIDSGYDEHITKILEIAPPANYEDSYINKPALMTNYLADDIVLVLRVVKELLPVLDMVDKGRKTWHRENQLIRVVGDMESNGLKVDVDYLIKSRERVANLINKKYKKLYTITEDKFSVGQHKYIKELFAKKYKIGMLETNINAMEEVVETYNGDPATVAKLILDIRSLEKLRSTYIEGMLNRIVDGKVYSDINNSGAVTGRVTSDMQQQPKEATIDADTGEELFHPRRAFITEDGYTNYYIDFDAMEMRVQAFYTFLVSTGDLNLCRAFIPFECFNELTGDKYDIVKDIDTFEETNWVYEDGTPWEKVDLHTATTLQAFPELTVDDPKFKHYRQLGKRVNFLKNYGGGKNKIIESMGLSDEIATALNAGYYKAFPKILDYQKWVDDKVKTYGFAENLYGRRYYFSDTRWSYKAYNYLVQGTCADFVKEREIAIYDFLKPYGSKMLLPIHDEIIFQIKKGEEHLVEKIKLIMQQSRHIMPYIPMTASVTFSSTNWAEGVDI